MFDWDKRKDPSTSRIQRWPPQSLVVIIPNGPKKIWRAHPPISQTPGDHMMVVSTQTRLRGTTLPRNSKKSLPNITIFEKSKIPPKLKKERQISKSTPVVATNHIDSHYNKHHRSRKAHPSAEKTSAPRQVPG